MFHLYAKYFLTLVVCFLAGFSAVAQNLVGENSPYSRFGIGEQRNGVNTLLKGMGSISSAYNNPFAVNTDNPASYAAIRLTTYEAGGEGSTRSVRTASDKYTTGMATLTHLNVGIPIGKNGGIAFGLKPNTRVYYLLQDTVNAVGVGRSLNTFNGNGGTNYGFIGAGYRYKGFSLGANIQGQSRAFRQFHQNRRHLLEGRRPIRNQFQQKARYARRGNICRFAKYHSPPR